MILELMEKGGLMMWIILGISVLALAIFLDRFVTLYLLSSLNAKKFIIQITHLIEGRNYSHAFEACNIRTLHPLPRVLKSGIVKSNRHEKEIARAMEKEMLGAIPSIQRGVGYLGLFANAATLLGLLGTIFGLMRAFSSVSAATGAARQQVLGDGITIAMYTTAFGLIVAIPTLFAHQIIANRADKMLTQIEEGATALLLAMASRLKDVPQPLPPETET